MSPARVSAVVLVLLTLLTVVVVGTSAMLHSAAEGLFVAVDTARGISSGNVASGYELWLGSQLAADLPPDALDARRQRAVELAYRSDRLREAAGATGLVALIFALLTAQPMLAADERRASHQLEAKTTSNGSV